MSGVWNWKPKDGSRGGLLYESGNWGDLLKMLWLEAVLEWKKRSGGAVNYFDPFAGDAWYPLTPKARFRIEQIGQAGLIPDAFAFLREAFLDRGFWPSAASGAWALLRDARGAFAIWDRDDGRRGNWREWRKARSRGERAFISIPDASSGWELLQNHAPDADGVWLIDPYDFLAEWRDVLPLVAEQSRRTTLLLYVYNRSAKNAEAFREYRAARNALDDLRGDLPGRIGRAASDGFLPRAHHEMWFLPCGRDAASPAFAELLRKLADAAFALEGGMRRTGVYDA